MHNIYHIKIGTFFNLRKKDRKRGREREREGGKSIFYEVLNHIVYIIECVKVY